MAIESVRPTTSSPKPTDKAPSDQTGMTADPPLLPEPGECGLDDGCIAQLAILLTKADAQDRSNARRVEQSADRAAMQEENKRVQQLRDKADADGKAAWVSGALTMAGGLCTIGSACFQGGNESGAGKPFDKRVALEGASKVMPGLATLFSGGLKADADRADADAAGHQARADADVRLYNAAHDDVQAANESLQKVTQFLDQAQQTRNAMRLTAATYRA
jgi:hypothetical protein